MSYYPLWMGFESFAWQGGFSVVPTAWPQKTKLTDSPASCVTGMSVWVCWCVSLWGVVVYEEKICGGKWGGGCEDAWGRIFWCLKKMSLHLRFGIFFSFWSEMKRWWVKHQDVKIPFFAGMSLCFASSRTRNTPTWQQFFEWLCIFSLAFFIFILCGVKPAWVWNAPGNNELNIEPWMKWRKIYCRMQIKPFLLLFSRKLNHA